MSVFEEESSAPRRKGLEGQWDLQALECQQHQLIAAGWAGGPGLPLTFPGEHGAQHSSASGDFQAAQMGKNL